LVNVGSRAQDPNGRGRILRDLRFEYLPLDEKERARRGVRIPTFAHLGFVGLKHQAFRAHHDPEFGTFTYGHVRRFGDQLLYDLRSNRIRTIFFYANLETDHSWAPYIIGYFDRVRSVDCRKLSKKQILSFSRRGFSENAHLKRSDPHVDFLFKGGQGSRKLDRAFRLSDGKGNKRIAPSLSKLIRTPSGELIKAGEAWYRWTMLCTNCESLLRLIREQTQIMYE
jgi:hypothetical protein